MLVGKQLRRLTGVVATAAVAVSVFASTLKAEPSVQQYAFIYYANETEGGIHESANIAKLRYWLSQIELPSAAEASQLIEKDMTSFSKTVSTEIDSIVTSAPPQLGIAILTNASVLDGYYIAKAPGSREFDHIRINAGLRSPDPRLDSNPLGDGHVLGALLLSAASHVANDGRPIILVVKSHGSEAFALMPRTFVDTSRTDPTTLRDYLAQFEKTRLFPAIPPPWLEPVGVKKSDLMSKLEDVALSRGVRFSVVFLEACKGGVGLYGIVNSPDDRHPHPFVPWELPSKVDYFVSGGSELMAYSNIDYPRLFRRTAELGDFRSAFLEEVRVDGLTVQQHADRLTYLLHRGMVLLWFLPLAGWIVTIALLKMPRRRLPT
jgi:hypothetical protein